MEGTLVVNEERGKVNQFKEWYKQNIIDSGLSAKAEEFTMGTADLSKKIVAVVGGAGVTLGVALAAGLTISTGGLAIPVSALIAILCPIVLGVHAAIPKYTATEAILQKRRAEAKLIGETGESKTVKLNKLNSDAIVNTVKDFTNAGASLIKSVTKTNENSSNDITKIGNTIGKEVVEAETDQTKKEEVTTDVVENSQEQNKVIEEKSEVLEEEPEVLEEEAEVLEEEAEVLEEEPEVLEEFTRAKQEAETKYIDEIEQIVELNDTIDLDIQSQESTGGVVR